MPPMYIAWCENCNWNQGYMDPTEVPSICPECGYGHIEWKQKR